MATVNVVVLKPDRFQLNSLHSTGYCVFVFDKHTYEFHPIKSGKSIHLLIKEGAHPKHIPVSLVATHELENGDVCNVMHADPVVVVTIP
jgi:hypothetical protein